MNYKVIFLIISSSSDDYLYKDFYLELKKIPPLYYDLFLNEIKYFFIEYKKDLEQEILINNNNIYIKGEESIFPGIYNKTLKSLEYINKNYNFEYIVRTNLSSVWNIPNLLKLLNYKPNINYFGGFQVCDLFITGTGIIMSKNVSELIYTNYSNDCNSANDDIILSNQARNLGIKIDNIIEYKWGYLLDKTNKLSETINSRILDINNDSDDLSDILYFRIKSYLDLRDRSSDIFITKKILKKIYNLE